MSTAELTGMSGEAYQTAVGGAINLFQQQADASLRAQNIEPQAFYDYIWANHADETKAAMRAHAATRSPRAYAQLVSKYVANTSPSTAAMNAGGYETRTERDGTEHVLIPGFGWTTVKAAVKAGLI